MLTITISHELAFLMYNVLGECITESLSTLDFIASMHPCDDAHCNEHQDVWDRIMREINDMKTLRMLLFPAGTSPYDAM